MCVLFYTMQYSIFIQPVSPVVCKRITSVKYHLLSVQFECLSQLLLVDNYMIFLFQRSLLFQSFRSSYGVHINYNVCILVFQRSFDDVGRALISHVSSIYYRSFLYIEIFSSIILFHIIFSHFVFKYYPVDIYFQCSLQQI